MAKAPKCKVCGTQHWGSEPHQFPSEIGVYERYEGRPVPWPSALRHIAKELELADYLKAEKAKKAAYMREYRAGVRRRAERKSPSEPS